MISVNSASLLALRLEKDRNAKEDFLIIWVKSKWRKYLRYNSIITRKNNSQKCTFTEMY